MPRSRGLFFKDEEKKKIWKQRWGRKTNVCGFTEMGDEWQGLCIHIYEDRAVVYDLTEKGDGSRYL